ncbi:galactose oxidase [Lepidopterella palustris CBS 459.81]|uniref:Galactose oxidase n=1 Tax=Lepidopterella palustris CBS 459.81 TaxID=1314670 RepID=A0A8E2JBQ8_9PEZI|nr:galactose oxidase [Lepidopterella palustris CBS 459.81]
MAKDKKAKAASKKARAAQKAEKITKKKEKKSKTKSSANPEDSDAESVDLDAVLASYALQQEQFHAITETPSSPPSARSSATLIANPANTHELLLFGGEFYNGATATFYNDLFVYNIARDAWKVVHSPNSPLPRSGHAWCRAANTKNIFLFGGEFSSPKQGTFYHYNDFWCLDPSTREWTKVESKDKGPPARSGHRMVGWKNYVVLWGGFQDTAQTTKYLADLWVYDCSNFMWFQPSLPSASGKPDARSSFTLLPSELGVVLYGGYSRVKATTSGGGKQGKGGSGGGGGGARVVLKSVVHTDTWFLRLTPPPPGSSASTPPKCVWERRKRAANPPNPPRAGATMAWHKGRGIMFGGVHDVEESEEGIESEFFNTLFAWNVERNRYFPLVLRRPKMGGKKVGKGGEGRRGRAKAGEEELLRNLAALEMRGRIEGEEEGAGKEGVEGLVEGADEVEEVAEKVKVFEMPHPRFNAQLTVQDDVLYIFGGTFEKGDREYTFDEMWAIDLGKLDGVKEIYKRDLGDWQGSDDEQSDDEDDEDDDEEGSDEDENEDEDERPETPSTPATSISQGPSASKYLTEPEEEMENTNETSALTDTLPHPRPFESLRDFYARTSTQWQEIVIDELSRITAGEAKSVKELKKAAFDNAEEKWWDCREEIRALEDEQEQAGIGEVVSMADKGGEGGGGVGGVGRRR